MEKSGQVALSFDRPLGPEGSPAFAVGNDSSDSLVSLETGSKQVDENAAMSSRGATLGVEKKVGKKQASLGGLLGKYGANDTGTAVKSGPAKPHSPVIEQFLDAKARFPECLLFFRMGDFYELFFEDAEKAAPLLGVQLTSRNSNDANPIPMCGVPVHSLMTYLPKVVGKGLRVAICDQLETPEEAKQRAGKPLLRRGVVRVVSQGTWIDDETEGLDRPVLALVPYAIPPHINPTVSASLSPSLMAEANGAVPLPDRLALAWFDLGSGHCGVETVGFENMGTALARIRPVEVILLDEHRADPKFLEAITVLLAPLDLELTGLARQQQDAETAWITETSSWPNEAHPSRKAKFVRQFGEEAAEELVLFPQAEQMALALLVAYASEAEVGQVARLESPLRRDPTRFLEIDAQSRRNLELESDLSGQTRGSLLQVLTQTQTRAGARELRQRLRQPLMDRAALEARLDAVDFFVSDASIRKALRQILSGMPDLRRLLSRLALGRLRPTDLGRFRDGLILPNHLLEVLDPTMTKLPELLVGITRRLLGSPVENPENTGHLGSPAHRSTVLSQEPRSDSGPRTVDVLSLGERLNQALEANLPSSFGDEPCLKAGFAAGLDQARGQRNQILRDMTAYEASLRKRYGSDAIKIKHNQILGYFIEAPTRYGKRLEVDLNHRQTTANLHRFDSPELRDFGSSLEELSSRIRGLEQEEVNHFIADLSAAQADIARIADSMAELDVHMALAECAERGGWCRPQFLENPDFEVRGGRHPSVERARQALGSTFIQNDCLMPRERNMLLITGPNMAGKSTYLRQNALIPLLAQMGSYVPAESARMGLVDAIFCRAGAADDLSRGQSTFMVEMSETALMLNRATPQSLLVFDEIGRGTATIDGLSIAAACLEYLHDRIKARTLFATHFHELGHLPKVHKRITPWQAQVSEWQDRVIFTHRIVPGLANRSYGVHVASLAGLPEELVARAAYLLDQMEAGHDLKRSIVAGSPSPSLTASDDAESIESSTETEAARIQAQALLDWLAGLDLDSLTGRDAMNLLHRWKDELTPKREQREWNVKK